MVKRLRRRPLTAKTGVRVPVAVLRKVAKAAFLFSVQLRLPRLCKGIIDHLCLLRHGCSLYCHIPRINAEGKEKERRKWRLHSAGRQDSGDDRLWRCEEVCDGAMITQRTVSLCSRVFIESEINKTHRKSIEISNLITSPLLRKKRYHVTIGLLHGVLFSIGKGVQYGKEPQRWSHPWIGMFI